MADENEQVVNDELPQDATSSTDANLEPTSQETAVEEPSQQSAAEELIPASGDKAAEAVSGGTPEPVQFSAQLLERANNYAMSKEEVERFKSPDDLNFFLTSLDRQAGVAALRSQQQSQQQASQQAQQQSASAQPVPSQVPAFELPNLDEYGPEVSQAIKGMHEHYQARVNQLEGMLGQVVGVIQQIGQGNEVATFDRFREGLGDDFKDLAGTGQVLDLETSNPAAFEACKKVYGEYQLLKRVAQSRGERVNDRELLDRAAHYVWKDRYDEINRRKMVSEVAARKKQAMTPSLRRSGPTSSEVGWREAAVADAERILSGATDVV